MKKIFEDVQTQATLTKLPPIMSLLPQKHVKKKLTRRTQIFFGNKAFEQFRHMRDVGQRMNVWWQHHEPDFYYRQLFEKRRHRGKHKDDWTVDYRAWSPTKGMSVEIEWLDDVKSSKSVKFEV